MTDPLLDAEEAVARAEALVQRARVHAAKHPAPRHTLHPRLLRAMQDLSKARARYRQVLQHAKQSLRNERRMLW